MTDAHVRDTRHPIGVLIVEDSRTVRGFLEEIVGHDPRLRVLASVESGEEALRTMERVRPDVISLDIRLPGMNGFEVTRRVMSTRPTPIVVCSASVEGDDLHITMNALHAGALAVVEKPVGTSHEDYSRLAERLCGHLVLMSGVKVIRQWGPRRAGRPGEASDAPDRSQGGWCGATPMIVGIAASTGGPSALTTVLNSLSEDFAAPILIVQHITASFADGFIDWLGTVCPFPVVKARTGVVPEPGRVYVAPGDEHLTYACGCLRTESSPAVFGQRPSGDVLLSSMARSAGRRAAGVVLTGMGEDGARGLKAIRDAGGFTIAEHRSTAVVYGMPGAAERLSAVCEQLPLGLIGPRLSEVVARSEEVRHVGAG